MSETAMDMAQIEQDAYIEPAWVEQRRKQAEAAYRAHGLPTSRLEAWKYTNLAPKIEALAPSPPRPVSARELPAPLHAQAKRLVLIDSVISEDLSDDLADIDGLEWTRLSSALAEDDERLALLFPETEWGADRAMAAVNLAYTHYGALLKITKSLQAPLEVLRVSTGGVGHSRCLIEMNPDTEATVIDRYWSVGDSRGLATGSQLLRLAPGAHLTHLRLFEDEGSFIRLPEVRAELQANAEYQGLNFHLSPHLARDHVTLNLQAPGGVGNACGIYLLRDQQHCDMTVFANHAAPHCNSRQVFAGVLDGSSRGVFQGKALVQQVAQHTDAHQLNRALMLSPKAEIDSKPELEIYADDVKCGHGATVGQLDAEQLFYLRSRGIPELEARAMLIQSFVSEPLETVSEPELKLALLARIMTWLGQDADQVLKEFSA